MGEAGGVVTLRGVGDVVKTGVEVGEVEVGFASFGGIQKEALQLPEVLAGDGSIEVLRDERDEFGVHDGVRLGVPDFFLHAVNEAEPESVEFFVEAGRGAAEALGDVVDLLTLGVAGDDDFAVGLIETLEAVAESFTFGFHGGFVFFKIVGQAGEEFFVEDMSVAGFFATEHENLVS